MTDHQITPSQAADTLLELENILAEALHLCCERPLDEAREHARRLVERLRERRGGEELYIAAPSKAARDEAIRRDFNGTNLAEVMARYKVSSRTVYRACGGRG